jgi:hypothetical protein
MWGLVFIPNAIVMPKNNKEQPETLKVPCIILFIRFLVILNFFYSNPVAFSIGVGAFNSLCGCLHPTFFMKIHFYSAYSINQSMRFSTIFVESRFDYSMCDVVAVSHWKSHYDSSSAPNILAQHAGVHPEIKNSL